MTLSQRIQTASADETRALLEEAFEVIHGKSPDWLRWYGDVEQKHEARSFDAKLNAEAYVDAALMLVPEGMAWTIGYGQILPDQLLYAAVIGRNAKWAGYGANYDAVARSEGKTPAIAIASAALKAKDTP